MLKEQESFSVSTQPSRDLEGTGERKITENKKMEEDEMGGFVLLLLQTMQGARTEQVVELLHAPHAAAMPTARWLASLCTG